MLEFLAPNVVIRVSPITEYYYGDHYVNILHQLSEWTIVKCDDATFFLTRQVELRASGDNYYGQLGLEGLVRYATDSPPLVPSPVLSVTTSGLHTLLITTNTRCW